jgi:hypothetical protein
MAENRIATCTVSAAETEDWLAMELEEQNGASASAFAWCLTHARPLIAVVTLTVMGTILGGMIFG